MNLKNTEKKINLIDENYNNKLKDNILQNEKKEENEIIIELEIKLSDKEKVLYILCDKNKLEEDKKKNYKNSSKEFDYFNKENTLLYLNNEKIKFNYKINLNKIGINKIKIISNIKLFSLASMFYNCNQINKINFIKINTNNITDMNSMFSYCENLSELDLSSFNTFNVTDMKNMFSNCKNLSKLNL